MEGLESNLMYWYVTRCKTGELKTFSTLNKQVNMNAFIPKNERCLVEETAEFIVKEIYPDYVFIKSDLDQEAFTNNLKSILKRLMD